MHTLIPPLPPQLPLLRDACEAHGGLERWSGLERIDVHLRVRPFLFLSRFLSPRLRILTAQVDTKRVRAVLTPYPRQGLRGVYEGDSVRIESEDGQVLEALDNAREVARRRILWSELHALYFFGYAFWNYTHTPFLFLQPGFDFEALPEGRVVLGRPCRRLRVRFPSSIPTHSTEQTFYFDERGLLRRLDYVADVFGRWSRGAHFVDDPRDFGGLVFPTHRFVRPRGPGGQVLPGPLAIEGWIDDIDLHANAR